MRHASAGIALLWLVGSAAPAVAQHPAWAELEGLVVGGPVDVVFPLGFDCRPAIPPGTALHYAAAYAAFLFADVLPHSHHDDSAAVRSLDRGTVCRGRIWGDSASVLVFSMDRRIATIRVFFASDTARAMAVEDVRARVRALWGRGSGPPQLEEWGSGRYRAYLMDGIPVGDGPGERRLTLYDVRACTAFDRLVHKAGEPGKAAEC